MLPYISGAFRSTLPIMRSLIQRAAERSSALREAEQPAVSATSLLACFSRDRLILVKRFGPKDHFVDLPGAP